MAKSERDDKLIKELGNQLDKFKVGCQCTLFFCTPHPPPPILIKAEKDRKDNFLIDNLRTIISEQESQIQAQRQTIDRLHLELTRSTKDKSFDLLFSTDSICNIPSNTDTHQHVLKSHDSSSSITTAVDHDGSNAVASSSSHHAEIRMLGLETTIKTLEYENGKLREMQETIQSKLNQAQARIAELGKNNVNFEGVICSAFS